MRRNLGRITDFRSAQSIEELQLLARRRLPRFAFEYIDGGAEDERSVRRNLRTFRRIGFAPRNLSNPGRIDLSVSLFERWRARHALGLLLRQTERTLGQLGCGAFADLRPDMLHLPRCLQESER